VTYRIPAWFFGRGGDAGDRVSLSRDTASVSWARLRERIGAGLDEHVTGFAVRARQDEEEVKEKPPAATPSPIYLVIIQSLRTCRKLGEVLIAAVRSKKKQRLRSP
jgi:hypothetical protein